VLAFFAVIAGVANCIAIIFSAWKYFASKKVKIAADSFLRITENGNFISVINVLNESQPPIEIWSIRFDIFSWNQSPKLMVHGLLKAQRAVDFLLEREGTWFFPSDNAQIDRIDTMPCHLMTKKSMSINIDLDKMMEEHFNYGEGGHFENRLFFWLSMRFLNILIETTEGKLVKLRAHREIRKFLFTKYKTDTRILRSQK
jgi:hypothetical protein